MVIIHHAPMQTVRYLAQWRLLGATLEELRALGPQFSPMYFNAAESELGQYARALDLI